MKKLLIEGWRDVNHSYALVNQCQILELLKFDGLKIFHRDLPYARPHWNAQDLDAGFAAPEREQIAALREPGDDTIDCVYRITSPLRAPRREGRTAAARTLTFMVTELGIGSGSFEPGADAVASYQRDDDLIVTPSRWARDRLVDHGFDASGIQIVTHGVRSDTFFPLSAEERRVSRANLGLAEGETVFLNLAAPLWNKGVDVLLLAFARLRQRHKSARLMLKDQRGLYGLSVEKMLQDLTAAQPALFTADTLGAIQVVAGNLSQAQLRLLYGVADCYVSPYRAEGFNLPVLESLACGTPVLVTAGGATDDFCNHDVSLRIPSTLSTQNLPGRQGLATYCEPDGTALVELMARWCTGSGLDRAAFEIGRRRLVQTLTWHSVAEVLFPLMFAPRSGPARANATAPAAPEATLA